MTSEINPALDMITINREIESQLKQVFDEQETIWIVGTRLVIDRSFQNRPCRRVLEMYEQPSGPKKKNKALDSGNSKSAPLPSFWRTQYLNIIQPLTTLSRKIEEYEVAGLQSNKTRKATSFKVMKETGARLKQTKEVAGSKTSRKLPDLPPKCKLLKKQSTACFGSPLRPQLLSFLSLPRETEDRSRNGTAKNWSVFALDGPHKLYRVSRKVIPPIKTKAGTEKTRLVQVRAIRVDETGGEKIVIRRQDAWEVNSRCQGRPLKKTTKRTRKHSDVKHIHRTGHRTNTGASEISSQCRRNTEKKWNGFYIHLL